MLCRTCKFNYSSKVRIVGLRLVVQVDCVSKKDSCRVVECSKCILLVRFADFAVVDQTGSERLEGLDQKSSSGYSEKFSPGVLDVCTN